MLKSINQRPIKSMMIDFSIVKQIRWLIIVLALRGRTMIEYHTVKWIVVWWSVMVLLVYWVWWSISILSTRYSHGFCATLPLITNLGALNLKMTNFKLPQIGSLDDFDCLRIFWEQWKSFLSTKRQDWRSIHNFFPAETRCVNSAAANTVAVVAI